MIRLAYLTSIQARHTRSEIGAANYGRGNLPGEGAGGGGGGGGHHSRPARRNGGAL